MRRRRLQKRAEKAVKSSPFWGRKKKRRSGYDDSDDEGGNGNGAEEGYPNTIENSTRPHIPMNDDTQYRLVSLDVSGIQTSVLRYGE